MTIYGFKDKYLEFNQRIRELVSLRNTLHNLKKESNPYNQKMEIEKKYSKEYYEEEEQLKKIAIENGFDYYGVYKDAFADAEFVTNPNFSNPLTNELCEAILDHFVETGCFNIRMTKSKSFCEKGPDYYNNKFLKDAENESMNVGLRIFLDNIKKLRLSKVNPDYFNLINKIGIEKLEDYLETGVADEDLKDFLKQVYEHCYNYETENIGSNSKSLQAPDDEIDVFRMYFNMPETDNSIAFIKDYQIQCQKLGIHYQMKAFKNRASSDGTIFYSSYDSMNTRLKIIKELLNKYPDIQLGTPPIGCSKLEGFNSKVGICNLGTIEKKYNMSTYNEYVDSLAVLAFCTCFGNMISADSERNRKIYENLLNKERNMFNYRIGPCAKYDFGLDYPDEKIKKENEKVVQMVKSLLKDPTRKQVIVQKFKDIMQKYHNLNNGFAYDAKSNIAMNTWYIERERRKHKNIVIGDLRDNQDLQGHDAGSNGER